MWDAIVAWFQSPGGARVLQTAIIPALAILVAGLLAALIARSAVRATLRRAERVEATSAVAGLVAAARTAADADDDPVARRRATRLRSEADVRTRLLPLDGAELAADWASARIDALQAADAPTTAGIAELRDRLVEWVGKPGRARRIFVASVPPAARAATPASTPTPAAVAVPEPKEPAVPAEVSVLPEPEQAADKDRFAHPGPRRTPPEPEPAALTAAEPEPEPKLQPVDTVAAPAAAAPTALPTVSSADALPAWQRTRAVERLQQERERTRGVEAPTAEEQPAPLGTAPGQLPKPHRVDAGQPAGGAADAEEAVRLEAHQQARHARPAEQVAEETGAGAAAATTPTPAWLDQYDDEAQVTQNLDLKTPPPVSASSVRDRGAGDDLVPRS